MRALHVGLIREVREARFEIEPALVFDPIRDRLSDALLTPDGAWALSGAVQTTTLTDRRFVIKTDDVTDSLLVQTLPAKLRCVEDSTAPDYAPPEAFSGAMIENIKHLDTFYAAYRAGAERVCSDGVGSDGAPPEWAWGWGWEVRWEEEISVRIDTTVGDPISQDSQGRVQIQSSSLTLSEIAVTCLCRRE